MEINKTEKDKKISDNTKKSLSIVERRGLKIEKFKLPTTKEKEDTTIEHIKPLF